MPDISEGLSSAPEDMTFEEALASKGLEDPSAGTESPAVDTSISAGLTTAEPDGPTRDSAGRFTPTETPAPEDTSVTETVEEVDPTVAAYLAKYGGDTTEALKAAANAASLIGRQGEELGKTREEMAELRGRLDAYAQQQAVAPVPYLSDDQVQERAITLSSTQGYFQAAATLANEAFNGDQRPYDALLSNWALEDPIAAQRFDLDFQLWKRDQSAPAPVAPTPDARLESVLEAAEVTNMAQSFNVLSKEYGDNWPTIEPYMDAAIEALVPTIADLVANGTPDERLAGMRIIADRAFLMAQSDPASTATRSTAQVAAAQAAQAAEDRKALGSHVASGTLRPAEATEAVSDKEKALNDFRAAIVGADSTRVIDGLTYK